MSSATPHPQDMPGAQAAAAIAERCRSLLKARCGGGPVTVETLLWDGGGFSVTAYQTVRHEAGNAPFTREVVTYTAGDNPDEVTGAFVHAVRHYYSGHHEAFH